MTFNHPNRTRYVQEFYDAYDPKHPHSMSRAVEAALRLYQQDQEARQAAMVRVIEAARHVKHVAQAPRPKEAEVFGVRGWAIRELLKSLDVLDATEQEGATAQ